MTLTSSALSATRLMGATRFTATKVAGKGFYLEGSGATRVTMDGTVSELLATMSGASRLDSESLQSETVELSISGAGRLYVARKR